MTAPTRVSLRDTSPAPRRRDLREPTRDLPTYEDYRAQLDAEWEAARALRVPTPAFDETLRHTFAAAPVGEWIRVEPEPVTVPAEPIIRAFAPAPARHGRKPHPRPPRQRPELAVVVATTLAWLAVTAGLYAAAGLAVGLYAGASYADVLLSSNDRTTTAALVAAVFLGVGAVRAARSRPTTDPTNQGD